VRNAIGDVSVEVVRKESLESVVGVLRSPQKEVSVTNRSRHVNVPEIKCSKARVIFTGQQHPTDQHPKTRHPSLAQYQLTGKCLVCSSVIFTLRRVLFLIHYKKVGPVHIIVNMIGWVCVLRKRMRYRLVSVLALATILLVQVCHFSE
jgi:hypothetical protein